MWRSRESKWGPSCIRFRRKRLRLRISENSYTWLEAGGGGREWCTPSLLSPLGACGPPKLRRFTCAGSWYAHIHIHIHALYVLAFYQSQLLPDQRFVSVVKSGALGQVLSDKAFVSRRIELVPLWQQLPSNWHIYGGNIRSALSPGLVPTEQVYHKRLWSIQHVRNVTEPNIIYDILCEVSNTDFALC